MEILIINRWLLRRDRVGYSGFSARARGSGCYGPSSSPGYVLAREVDPNLGNLSLTFSVGRNADGKRTRYLLCRGPTCSQPKALDPDPIKLNWDHV